MNNRIILVLVFSSIALIRPAFAADNFWQCRATDALKQQWEARGSYERVAVNKAFETCKKESKVPTTCVAASDSCNYFGTPVVHILQSNHGPAWKCTSLDRMAKFWDRVSANRDSAALSAKSACVQHSSVPDTCYLNFITCRNMNED